MSKVITPGVERRDVFHKAAVAGLEKRAEGDEGREVIVGYGAVYYNAADPGTQYDIFGDGTFIERIMPGAFDAALARPDDVRCLVDHDPSRILGRNIAGTLRLSADSRGLRYECDPPDTSVGRDILVSLRRKDVTGSSFAFIEESQRWTEEGDVLIRELLSVRLFDVSPVTYPAFTSADVTLARRSAEIWRAMRRRNRLSLAKRRLEIVRR